MFTIVPQILLRSIGMGSTRMERIGWMELRALQIVPSRLESHSVTNLPFGSNGGHTGKSQTHRQGLRYFPPQLMPIIPRYHAHFSTSRIDGLFGPFIIHSPKENIRGDTDRIVMVHDYYHDLSAALLPQYLAPDNENDEPVPDGALINGMGICSTCEPSLEKLATFGLDRGKTHRLRFINVGAFAEFDVEIDQHELSLVEVDGVEVEPYRLHRFRINVAQRYSVILHANQPAESYWLRARMIAHCFAGIPEDLKPEVLGIVRYTANEEKPTTKGWGEAMELECKDLNTSEIVPAVAMPAPEPDALIYIRSNFEIGSYRLSRGFFNKTSWRPAEVPTLVQAIDGLARANRSFAPEGILPAYDINRQMVYRIDGIKTIDLLIDNFDDG